MGLGAVPVRKSTAKSAKNAKNFDEFNRWISRASNKRASTTRETKKCSFFACLAAFAVDLFFVTG